MIIKRICCVLTVISFIFNNFVYCQTDVRSSLTFVIDDTGSMEDDIYQVKQGVNAIFDTVMRYNSSQIENFIIVTFNDPGFKMLTNTKDRHVFRNKLNSIKVGGGKDCPEKAMKGIQLALQESLPSSYLYVFTDASTKDYDQIELVKSLAIKQSSQIVFVLTGMCSNEQQPDYQVYHTLAEATSGQVFHLMKDEVGKILDYVQQTIKSRKTVIATKKFPPGYGHKFNYTVDDKMKDVLVSLSGKHPRINVTGPSGSTPVTKDIIRTEKIAVVKISDTKPGVHTAEVGSRTNTTVVVTGTSTINFRHGFSPIKPTSIEGTATRPISDIKSYLSIQLITDDEHVQLTAVQLIDKDENVVIEQPLQIVNEKRKFYATLPFVPPNNMFKIAIKGFSTKSKTPITRLSPTFIEPQKPSLEIKKNKAPILTVEGESKVDINYDEYLQLKCKVSGYPKPTVVWVEKNTKAVLPSNVSAIELPYDYLSVVDIGKMNKNTTYQCKATNEHGEDSKDIEVITKAKPYYFNIVERPKNASIYFEKEGRFLCKIDAYPPATISWYRNGKELHKNDDFDITSDGSIFTIKHMHPKLTGLYLCQARNHYNNTKLSFIVTISGLVPPKIDKRTNEIHIKKGSDVDITCRIIQGIPKPTITWFFNHVLGDKFTKIDITTKEIHVRNASTDDAGVYRCIALNVVGRDFCDTELIVEYPPSIVEDDIIKINAKDGETVTLKCDVDAVPAPTVQWFANNTAISNGEQHHIYRDYSLSFTAKIKDTGNYTCKASNEYGTAYKTVLIDVTVPVMIEPPKESHLKVMVGRHVALPCRADGYPQPNITWIHYSMNPKIRPKRMKASDKSSTKILRSVQIEDEGFYTCVASNVASSANITYQVDVHAPPRIINVYPEKKFTAVDGDLLLKIPCKATGNPKPTITWVRGGLNLPSGSEWFDIEEDGTLIIKNVDELAEGTYVCEAKNYLGIHNEYYDVIVHPYPDPGSPTSTLLIQEGKSSFIKCNVPHKKVDRIRWYKDRRIITMGELYLNNVTTSDSGIYTCRVSAFSGSRSGNTMIKVGFKPKFMLDESKQNTIVDYEEGMTAVLHCSAVGEPTPKVTWWHNGKKINVTDMRYEFDMSLTEQGVYFCLVNNEFGEIFRRFEVTPRECTLNMVNLDDNEPLILSLYDEWPTFENTRGNMRIPTDESITLRCPGGFKNFPKTELVVSCDRGTDFLIEEDKVVKYENLKCKEEVKPVMRRTGRSCLPGNTDRIKIGYESKIEFYEVYEVCLDIENRVPLYSKQRIHSSLVDSLPKHEPEWFGSDLLPYNFNELYDCKLQINTISSLLGSWFHSDYGCCFSKRQLVNSRDVAPGLPQKATYSYLNLIPQWSTCNAKNWEDIEQRIRFLARSTDYYLNVWTGTSQHLKLSKEKSPAIDIYIIDKDSRQQKVPQYLWKVVQDPVTNASLAIIQVNIPDLTLSEASHHIFCRDICREVDWMKSTNWRDVERGFTYCCRIQDFEKAFGYSERLFERGIGKILYDVSFISEHSLT